MTTLRSSPLAAGLAILLLAVAFLFSSAKAAGPRDRVPPTAPTNLVVTGTTEHSVSLSWGPSTDNSGRFHYLVCCAPINVVVPQTQTSFTLTGLDSGETYVLRVYAQDAAGNLSKSSNRVTVTLPGAIAAPTKPQVNVLDLGPTHVRLTWLSTDDKSPIWYTIYRDGQAVKTLNSLSFTFGALEQSTTYIWTVKARDVDGNNSPLSDPVVTTTLPPNPNDHIPPTQPLNVTATDAGLILVRWQHATDDFTPQALITYRILLNGTLQGVVAGQTTFEVDPVSGVNTITLIALDESDNQSLPASATIVMP